MRDVRAVLREKKTAIKRVRREIEALRLVCQMMESEKDSPVDSIRITLESSGEREEKTNVASSADEKKAAIEQIRARFEEGGQKEVKKENERSVLLQCRQAAVNASHTFLKRVRDSRLWERDPQRNSIRDFLDRLGRAA